MSAQTDAAAKGRPVALEIEELHRDLELLAAKGRWSKLADVMRRRDELLVTIDEADRGILFRSAIRSNIRVLKLAQADRHAVARQLSSLRRSRDGVIQYGRCQALGSTSFSS